MDAKQRRSGKDLDDTERRIRAAMDLAGIDFKELAGRINLRGYGERNLRDLKEIPHAERRDRLAPIARACGVPVDFFVTPIDRLGGSDTSDLVQRFEESRSTFRGMGAQLREERHELERRFNEQLADMRSLLAENNRMLAGMTTSLQEANKNAARGAFGPVVDRLPDGLQVETVELDTHAPVRAKPGSDQARNAESS